MIETITWKTKRKAKKGQKRHSSQEPKKEKKLVPLVIGSYLTHRLSNVHSNHEI
jgi:hypothetical protein